MVILATESTTMLSLVPSLVFVGGLLRAAAVGASTIAARDGPSPLLPHDAEASKYCSWWLDLNTAVTCSSILSDNFISLEDFRRWVRVHMSDQSRIGC